MNTQWIKPTLKVHVTVKPIGFGKVTVLSLDAETQKPLDRVFTGPWRAGLREKVKRFNAWCEQRETLEATADDMPVMF